MKYIGVGVICIGISMLIATLVYNAIPKTAFVDNHRLFEAFEGRKELEQRLKQVANQRKSKLDSLSLQIQALERKVQENPTIRQRWYGMQQQYEQLNQANKSEYQEKSQEYTEAIWKQISQYTIEYGEEKGYDYVFGIAGQGSLMYGKDHYDITEEVANYINSKYAGN